MEFARGLLGAGGSGRQPHGQDKVELGRALFHDPRISGNGTQSCASCHAQASAFTDNRALSRGATGEVHPRNAQPLANVAFSTTLNWANPNERTLISADSRYDQSVAGKITLTAQEMRGQKLFFSDQAKCLQCHGSANFNDQFSTAASVQRDPLFHNTGLFNMGATGAYPEPNRGVYEITKLGQDMGKFRAASLRNIELTAPYMHDGSMATLEEVLDFYAAGGRDVGNGLYAGDGRLNPYKDARISQITLSAADKSDLLAFLKTLTDIGFVTNAAISAPAP